MSKKPKFDPADIDRVARETQEKLMRHMRANTMEEDAKKEAEREARLAALFEEFEKEGNLPGRVHREE